MKIRIISLFFSLTLILLSVYENSSIVLVFDSSTAKTTELVFEKKQADKILDDNHLLCFLASTFFDKEEITYAFEENFHSFKSHNTLFRPPIFA